VVPAKNYSAVTDEAPRDAHDAAKKNFNPSGEIRLSECLFI